MYPYESRLRWILSSRYNHILQALELKPHPRHDSLVSERARSLRKWDRVRTGVSVLLYIGFAAAAIAYAGNFVPFLAEAAPYLRTLVGAASALTGLMTLAYLFLSRLLSQIEADILMLLSA
ncbi:MAG TPA: hypothetical protein VM286_02675 [Candidatus Thermoplasmatota archaeon]|nr:hypothetical protein [Candidatus Thermoplasmatota archaeon]